MKSRLLMASAIVALTCGTAYAGKTADQVRIYINPGHGSWTGNDRPCQTIGRQPYNIENVDTTGFFESNTNASQRFRTPRQACRGWRTVRPHQKPNEL